MKFGKSKKGSKKKVMNVFPTIFFSSYFSQFSKIYINGINDINFIFYLTIPIYDLLCSFDIVLALLIFAILKLLSKINSLL